MVLSRRVQPGQPPLPESLPNFRHIHRYWDNGLGSWVAKILPGEFYVTKNDEYVATVLGSCVSACVRDPQAGVGGMNHFMLPDSSGEASAADPFSMAARYGNVAMELLINEILKNGGQRQRLEIKLFGGGRILTTMTDIGEKNIKFVRAYLRTEGLVSVADDLGDIFPRKVLYDPIDGKVKVKKLRALNNTTIIEREQSYREKLLQEKAQGDVDLF